MAEDVKAFVIALDLYVAPVAVVGCGMGAAVGLALAAANPYLVGAMLAAEFALPVRALQAAAAAARAALGAGCTVGDTADLQAAPASAPLRQQQEQQHPALKPAPPRPQQQQRSLALLPWWGFRAGQATAFTSVEQCAAFLAHPLANLAPAVLPSLLSAAQAAAAQQQQQQALLAAGGSTLPLANSDSSSGDAVPTTQQLLAQLQRPLRGAVASALSLLRAPSDAEEGGCWDVPLGGGSSSCGGMLPRMDPTFLFSFDAAALVAGLPNLRCHLLLLVGGAASGWARHADADAMARLAAGGGAASARAVTLPTAGHWLAADHPDSLLKQIVGFLEGPAVRCFDRRRAAGGNAQAAATAVPAASSDRLPERLGLLPLPQYATLEDARKVCACGGGPSECRQLAALDKPGRHACHVLAFWKCRSSSLPPMCLPRPDSAPYAGAGPSCHPHSSSDRERAAAAASGGRASRGG